MEIKRALISVYNKENIIDLVKFLISQEIEVIATGNTYKTLLNANLQVQEISDYTGFPEIMGGRVKTLHPKIHGGILNNRSSHSIDAQNLKISNIDLVIVNLYPFWQTAINKSFTEEQIIEQIDIGGVTLLRASAKNFHYVTVIHDIKDYEELKTQLISNKKSITLEYRRYLSLKAFAVTATYDANIHSWLNTTLPKEEEYSKSLPETFILHGKNMKSLRSGENPHQKAAFYSHYNNNYPFEQLCGKELSYNNILDIESAINIVSEFNESAAAIIKHNNPCGVAISSNITDAYEKAFICDEKSSFGGIIALNRNLNIDLAIKLSSVFIEVIIAPSMDDEAINILKRKKNLRLLLSKPLYNNELYDLKIVRGGFLLQERNKSKLLESNLQHVTKRHITDAEKIDLLFAWKVCKHVKSNAIVIAKNGATIGIGAGQMSRIDSLEIAISKAKVFKGAVLASDAFFPFSDSIIVSAQAGITAIIQPGGSIRDKEVIEETDKNNIAMLFTNIRNFYH